MNMMAFLVQIVLESLPISSSGHAQLLGLQMPDYLDRLALGPTLVVLAFYFYKEIVAVLLNFKKHWRWVCAWALLIIMATSVTVFCYEIIDQWLRMASVPFSLWLGCVLTTGLLFSLRWCSYGVEAEPNFWKFFFLGVAQGLARLPGVSRLGTTYVVACWLGYTPQTAFRISCALQAPLFAAGFLEGVVKVWQRGGLGFEITPLVMLLLVVAMVIAYLLLWFVEELMVRHVVWYVGWYTLAIAVISFCCDNLEMCKFILVR
jgi:undecaprenyl-diphosphatase